MADSGDKSLCNTLDILGLFAIAIISFYATSLAFELAFGLLG